MTAITTDRQVYTAIAKSLFMNPDGFMRAYDYDKIIEALGDIVARGDTNDCQGDTVAIVKRDGKFGFVAFTWGSCSGCDALQACDSYEEVGELIESIDKSIVWKDTIEEMKAYVNSDEREMSHYVHLEFWPDLKQQVSSLS